MENAENGSSINLNTKGLCMQYIKTLPRAVNLEISYIRQTLKQPYRSSFISTTELLMELV